MIFFSRKFSIITFSFFHSKYFPSDKYVPFEKAMKRLSMIMFNDHFSNSVIQPLVPALLEVGGFQIPDKPAPLPEVNAKYFQIIL